MIKIRYTAHYWDWKDQPDFDCISRYINDDGLTYLHAVPDTHGDDYVVIQADHKILKESLVQKMFDLSESTEDQGCILEIYVKEDE